MQAVLESLAACLEAAARASYASTMLAVRTTLDEDQFAAAWAAGQSMPLEQVIAYAETNACRRRHLLGYFGDPTPAAANPSCCDNCAQPMGPAETAGLAQTLGADLASIAPALLKQVAGLPFPLGRDRLITISLRRRESWRGRSVVLGRRHGAVANDALSRSAHFGRRAPCAFYDRRCSRTLRVYPQ